MTCLEKVKIELPGQIDDCFKGGCVGCPQDYNYLSRPEWCKYEQKYKNTKEDCEKCWNRVIPGTENTHPIQTEEPKEKVPNVEYWTNEKGIVIGDLPPATPELKDKLDAICCGIKDSGARTEFESGAVRDIQKGKGRCDLMPLDVVAEILDDDPIIEEIFAFQHTGDVSHLYEALTHTYDELGFESQHNMLLEVAKHFEDGAVKYGESNWQKGIPVHCYIDSAVRHYLKYLRGDRDERHDRAFVWNIMCAIWTCKHKPELNEYRKADNK